MREQGSSRVTAGLWQVVWGTLASAVLAAAGAFVLRQFQASSSSRYFPWISGRALGIAAYLAMTALVALGLWMRHPLRDRVRLLHPESELRAHGALAAMTLALLIAHVCFLASDRYAGVGWVGAVVPLRSQYRPGAVALGTIACAVFLLVGLSAQLAGRAGVRHWLAVHHLSSAVFALAWLHGVLAGTDTASLRALYLATGGFVMVLGATRLALPTRRRDRARGVAP